MHLDFQKEKCSLVHRQTCSDIRGRRADPSGQSHTLSGPDSSESIKKLTRKPPQLEAGRTSQCFQLFKPIIFQQYSMLSPHRDASLNKRLQNKDYARIYRTTLHKLCLNQRERQRHKEKEVKETEEVGVHHEKRKLLGHSCTKRRQISKTQHN